MQTLQTAAHAALKRVSLYVPALMLFSLLFAGCETSAPTLESPSQHPPVMTYSVSDVSDIRSQQNFDAKALSIDGVLSVGVAGNSNDDAWLQVTCSSQTALDSARTVLGDSLNGIPIRFELSTPFEAQ